MSKLLLLLILLCVCDSICPKKKVLDKKLNSGQRKESVWIHNKLRQLIKKGQIRQQPRAVKMNNLKWDKELAKKAQKIANTCKFAHVEVQDKRFSVGQNLYLWSSTAPEKGFNATSAVYSWFNEHKLYKYPGYSKESGHYTQVIWADTKYVGCGYTYYKTKKEKFKYHKLFVCNYGPAYVGFLQG
ncbi:Venom allergen 3-like Protein [Tribolium castaneum]|uniref:Venom allergen 3-like Protein n=1 Tax=Tribolium castaneum TaxID=7070 RepID=D6W9F1_TRICA|nr:Venom allergen 3-like Protein [Tribolium castaneum]